MTTVSIGYEPLNIGEIIALLEPLRWDGRVVLPFGHMTLSGDFWSYRGYYEHLALGWVELTYRYGEKVFTVKDMIETLRRSMTKPLYGYKGGEFNMELHTPVWVVGAHRETGGGIVGVHDTGDDVCLILSKFD